MTPAALAAAPRTNTSTVTDLHERFERISIGQLRSSKTNPRTHFDPARLTELAASIAGKGVIEPLVVRQVDAGNHQPMQFEIVSGECRFRASQQAQQDALPCVVRLYTDEQVLEIQLEENIQRNDLTPLEQAKGCRQLIDANPTKHSAESIAMRIGMSPTWVWDTLKLLDLIPEAKQHLDHGRIARGHAVLMARLTPEDQKRVLATSSQFRHDGLWRHEAGFDFDQDRKPGKYDGLKPCSVRELESWIKNHIRFDVAHMAHAQPLQFEAVAAVIADAEAKPGRGKKVIPITFSYRVADDARDDEQRTYGSQSWERADGTLKSKTCDHSVLGVVAAGTAHYGEAFEVCVNRDKCRVHFGDVIRRKEKNQKLRAGGQGQKADKREEAEARRRKTEEATRVARDARWKAFKPALEKATYAAVGTLKTLSKPQFTAVLRAHRLPAGTTAAQLPKVLLLDAIQNTFKHAYYGDETRLIAWAKLLGVDVKACEPTKAAAKEQPAA